MRKARHTECMGEMRNAYKVLARKPEKTRYVEDMAVGGG
jgi:hypothetical protein